MNTEFALKNMQYVKGGIIFLSRYQLKLTSTGRQHVISQLDNESNRGQRQIANYNSSSFFIDLEYCIAEKINVRHTDIDSVIFDFEGADFTFSGLIPPGQAGAHYEWVDTAPMAK